MPPRSQYRTIFTTYIKYFILIISSILSPNVWKKLGAAEKQAGQTELRGWGEQRTSERGSGEGKEKECISFLKSFSP